jgi:FkbM family methyltransferase
MHKLSTMFFDAYARVASRRLLYPFHKGLYYLGARGMGPFDPESFAPSGERESFERVLANPEFRAVVGVGANVGEFASAVETNDVCRVDAFEPHPRTYAVLAGRQCTHVVTHQMALGAQPGTMTLYDVAADDGTQLASFYREVIERQTDDVASHTVHVETVDSVLAESDVDRIDLLKIDTEGHERSGLDRAQRALEQKRIPFVLFEFNEMNVASGTFIRDSVGPLPGFRFFRLLPDGLVALEPYSQFVWEIFAFQNVWAVTPELADRLHLPSSR